MTFDAPLRLRCGVMHYEWGHCGSDSLVRNLASLGSLEPNLPYAELWVGAHDKAPALTEVDGVSWPLNRLIKEYPREVLGVKVFERFGGALPFLLKVLSVRKALSIQAHPNRELAQELHAKDPTHFPDANHKPELAIALSDVSLLCGFRKLSQLRESFLKLPELRGLVECDLVTKLLELNDSSEQVATVLKQIYQSIVCSDAKNIEHYSRMLYERVRRSEHLTDEERWISRLESDYPDGDVGLFNFFLLNLKTLSPYEAVFIAPNVAHAYLEGTLVECMANSDNVVRVGLTEKFRDTSTLVSMLSYEPEPECLIYAKATEGRGNISSYKAPVEEFSISRVVSGCEVSFSTNEQLEILFFLDGSACLKSKDFSVETHAGDAFLIPAFVRDYSLKVSSGHVFRVVVPCLARP